MANIKWTKGRSAAAAILALIVSGFVISAVVAQTDELFNAQDKISMQALLEKRTTAMLHSILGHEKFLVSINLELNRARFETFKETWQAEGGAGGIPGRSGGLTYTLPALEDEALPGIPQKQTFESKKAAPEMGGEGVTKTTNVSINMPSDIFNRIAVTVMVDKSVSKTDVDTIKRMTPVILALNYRRGDTFSIATVTLKNKGLMGFLGRSDNSLLVNIVKYGFLFGLLAVLIVLFFNRAKTLLADLAPFFERTPEEAYPEEKEEEEKKKEEKMKEELEGAKGVEKKYFPFITENDVNKMKYYLRGKDPRTIAAILLYIEPAVSAKVFAKLPKEIKEAVAVSMAQPMQLSPDVLQRLEEDVKDGVAGTAGGVEEFMEIFNNLPGQETQSVLSTLERHTPEIARMVKKLKFTMDDVIALPDNELETLLTHCKPKDVAAMTMALKGEQAEKVQRVMNEDMKEMVTEWTDMAISLPKKKINESLEAIMAKAKELCANGAIAASRNVEDTDEFEYTSPTSGEKVVLTAPPKQQPRREARPAAPSPAPAAPSPAKETKAEAPTPAPQPEAKKMPPLPPLDKLAELPDDKLLALLNEINPKMLSIALQQDGEKIRAKIAKVSEPYLSKLTMYDTIIGKQPDWKIDEAKRDIMEKFARIAAA